MEFGTYGVAGMICQDAIATYFGIEPRYIFAFILISAAACARNIKNISVKGKKEKLIFSHYDFVALNFEGTTFSYLFYRTSTKLNKNNKLHKYKNPLKISIF